MGPAGSFRPQVGPCKPHELCYQGRYENAIETYALESVIDSVTVIFHRPRCLKCKYDIVAWAISFTVGALAKSHIFPVSSIISMIYVEPDCNQALSITPATTSKWEKPSRFTTEYLIKMPSRPCNQWSRFHMEDLEERVRYFHNHR